jgi:hypothetical protein
MVFEVASDKSAKPARKNQEVTLTEFEAQRLIGICIELLDVCSKVTGKIDPAIGTLISVAHDEVLSSVLRDNSESSFDCLDYTRQ